MAEAIAVVGAVASIVQLVEFGSRVLLRLNGLQSNLAGIPKAFQHVKAQLPVLLDTLEQTKTGFEKGMIKEDTKTALLPAIDGCRLQVELLDAVIGKILPQPDDSWREKSRKAILRLHQDVKVTQISTDLRGYIQTLTYYHAAASSTLRYSIESPFTPITLDVHDHTVESGTKDFKSNPAGLFMVPDILSSWFTGRVSQLHDIVELTKSSSCKRIAIYGMPGVGKTQVVLRYAAELRKIQPESNVFFIDATEKENLVQGFQKIHRILNLPREPRQDVIIETVKQWLVQHDKWLLLVDNVVRVDIVRPFLPAGDSGVVLYTTRNEACARTLGAAGKLRLLPLSGDESVALILKATDEGIETVSEQTRNAAAELGRLLGGLPLAIEQSAACVADRHWTLLTYLEKLRSSRVETLSQNPGPESIHLNVFDTFRLAMKQLLPTAVTLMKIMAHLDHHSVPMKLLSLGIKSEVNDMEESSLALRIPSSPTGRHQTRRLSLSHVRQIAGKLGAKPFGNGKPDHDMSAAAETTQKSLKALLLNGNELEKAMSSITATALVNRKENGSIWMHDLVRDLSLEETSPEEQVAFSTLAVTLCYSAFPNVPENYETWEDCEEIATHALVSLSHVGNREIPLTSASNLQLLLGLFYQARGRYNDALKFYEEAATAFQKTLGPSHMQTLTTINSIANLLDDQGKYEESLKWHEVALTAREKSLGPEHPDTLSTVNNMAASFRKQGSYEKAMRWYIRALTGFEKVLDFDHPDTLSTISNIANVLHEQGNYQEALQWHRRALLGRSKKLGRTHPQTLSTINNLAVSLSRQGEYKQALEWFNTSLSSFETLLGHDHPHTLSVQNNIAIALHDLGKLREALRWYELALEGRQKVLGMENPDTFSSLDNTANVLGELGDYEKAQKYHQLALSGRERVLGRNHPETICTINNIGVSSLNVSQTPYAEALYRFQEALRGFENELGPEHPFTLTAMYNVGIIHDYQGEYDQAHGWYTKALTGREKMLGMHVDTISTVNSIASLMKREGRTEESSQWYATTVARLHQLTLVQPMDSPPVDMGQYGNSRAMTQMYIEECTPLSEPSSGDQSVVTAPPPLSLKTHRLLTWCSNRIQDEASTEEKEKP